MHMRVWKGCACGHVGARGCRLCRRLTLALTLAVNGAIAGGWQEGGQDGWQQESKEGGLQG